MLSWVLQTVTISIIFIFLIHHLLHFFKSTLTVPKVKDLVNMPSQKYQNMYSIISKQNDSSMTTTPTSTSLDDLEKQYNFNEADLLPKTDTDNINMKNELKSFLKKQMNTNGGTSQNDSWININSQNI